MKNLLNNAIHKADNKVSAKVQALRDIEKSTIRQNWNAVIEAKKISQRLGL